MSFSNDRSHTAMPQGPLDGGTILGTLGPCGPAPARLRLPQLWPFRCCPAICRSGRMVDGSVRQTILLPVNLIPAATTTRIRLALLTHLPTGLLPSSEPPQAPDARFSLSHWSSSGDYPADQLAPLLRRQHLKLACSQLQQLGSFEEDPIEQAWFFQEGGSVPTVVDSGPRQHFLS